MINQHNGMLDNRDGMLDNHEDKLDNHGPDPWLTICTLNRTTWLNTQPPLICRVCRLSHSVAFGASDFVALPAVVDGSLILETGRRPRS